jgi:hypothetical protein
MGVLTKLSIVQGALKAPKSHYNKFSDFNYRSLEDICEAVKPLLIKNGLTMYIYDEIITIGDRYYIKASATVADVQDGDTVTVSAYAREAQSKPKFDEAQLTGSASSYARKYALNGLFLIDDTKDADTDEYTMATQEKPKPKPKSDAKPKAAKTADVPELPEVAEMKKAAQKFGIEQGDLQILIRCKYKVGIGELSAAQAQELTGKIKSDPDALIAWIEKRKGAKRSE